MVSAHGFLAVMIGGGVLIGMSLACTAAAIAMSVAARAVPATVRSTVLGLVSGQGRSVRCCQRRSGRSSTKAMAGAWVWPALWCWRWRWFRRPGLPAGSTGFCCRRLRPMTSATARPARARIAFGNASFVVMTCAYFVCGMQLVFLTTHLPSIWRSAAWIRCSAPRRSA